MTYSAAVPGNDFAAIPLDELPPPTVVEQLDFEQLRKQIIDRLSGSQPLLFDQYKQPVFLEAELVTSDNGEQYFKVPATELGALLYLDRESHPFVRWANTTAYWTMTQQQRFQQRSLSVFLQYAQDADLEGLGALLNVKRLMIDAGDPQATPPVPPTYESNQSFRRRIQLKPEAITTAGSRGSYIYHSLSADPTVKDAMVDRPVFQRSGNDIVLDYDAGLSAPQYGDVAITVLSSVGNGEASKALLDTVATALDDEKVRPGNDRPRTRSAQIMEYAIEVELAMYDGPDKAVVIAEAEKRLQAYADQMHRIGSSVRHAKIDHAAGLAGVENVNIISPAADILVNNRQAAYCTGITVREASV
ncbi:baseplate assembly protein [Endozoicomonas sp. ALB115]|uniref:baseplate assembly protein n=1 Tax=Endozoicomonas sp. ALB115 TaxID=3403074 RepID=UPI003BB7CD25